MEIVSREASGLRPPRYRNRIATPTRELWLHHTAGALDAGNNGVWWDDVRGIQNFHMAPPPQGRGWSDIAYSFIIGGGKIFEGRGAGVAGGHTKGRNTISHAICLIGNYEWMQPTQQDLYAIAWLMRHGRQQGWWGELTGDHSAAPGANTSCCGKNLRAKIPALRDAALLGNPIPGDDDMPLSKEDIKKVADAVWAKTLTYKGAGLDAPAELAIGDIFHHARLGAASKPSADVDELAIAQEILTHLDPTKIAAAIPDNLAAQVADELAARLKD